MGIRCADHVAPLYPQTLVLTSPTGCGRSVGIVRSRTKVTELKAKVFPVHMKGRGSRGMAPLILKLGTRWKWVVNFTPRPHYSRGIRRCPSNWKLGGRQYRSGGFGEENSLPLTRFKPRNLRPIAGGYTDSATPAPSLIIRPVIVTLKKKKK